MLRSGSLLSHFRLVEQIGEGRRGRVWKAVDTHTDRAVAVRVLPSIDPPERRERLARAIAAVAALDHPHIEKIEPVAQAGGIQFVLMELVTGPTLGRLIPTGGLSPAVFREHALRLTDTVGFAHRQGVNHLGLTSSRTVFDEEGRMRVTGFGLDEIRERQVESADDPDGLPTLTSDHEVTDRVSLPYMPPEWIKGQPLGARSDVFSLGVMLFQMAVGRLPFEGESMADLLVAIIHDQAATVTELNPALPERLATMIATSLEKDPERRFPTALHLHQELSRL